MGCGANPNYFNVFERNHFVEGNTVVNYNTAQGANYNFGGGYLLASTSGGGAGGSSGAGFEELSMNTYTVFRQNRIDSNGGILIEDDSANILVECESHVYIFACVFVCCDAFCHRLHHELTMCPNLPIVSTIPANSIKQSDLQICVKNTTRNIFVRGNDASTTCPFAH
jgi:hypothetical protein